MLSRILPIFLLFAVSQGQLTADLGALLRSLLSGGDGGLTIDRLIETGLGGDKLQALTKDISVKYTGGSCLSTVTGGRALSAIKTKLIKDRLKECDSKIVNRRVNYNDGCVYEQRGGGDMWTPDPYDSSINGACFYERGSRISPYNLMCQRKGAAKLIKTDSDCKDSDSKSAVESRRQKNTKALLAKKQICRILMRAIREPNCDRLMLRALANNTEAITNCVVRYADMRKRDTFPRKIGQCLETQAAKFPATLLNGYSDSSIEYLTMGVFGTKVKGDSCYTQGISGINSTDISKRLILCERRSLRYQISSDNCLYRKSGIGGDVWTDSNPKTHRDAEGGWSKGRCYKGTGQDDQINKRLVDAYICRETRKRLENKECDICELKALVEDHREVKECALSDAGRLNKEKATKQVDTCLLNLAEKKYDPSESCAPRGSEDNRRRLLLF